jgi:hypothetical protein
MSTPDDDEAVLWAFVAVGAVFIAILVLAW